MIREGPALIESGLEVGSVMRRGMRRSARHRASTRPMALCNQSPPHHTLPPVPDTAHCVPLSLCIRRPPGSIRMAAPPQEEGRVTSPLDPPPPPPPQTKVTILGKTTFTIPKI